MYFITIVFKVFFLYVFNFINNVAKRTINVKKSKIGINGIPNKTQRREIRELKLEEKKTRRKERKQLLNNYKMNL